MTNAWFFVDVEASGPCPGMGVMTEFGAVHYDSRETFHGVIYRSMPHPENSAVPIATALAETPLHVFTDFAIWLESFQLKSRPIFISDNPAYDWQWINYGFHHTLGRNPFGFSARRIGDFYAGLKGDFSRTQDWKKLRQTPHDHNPVNDALGNAEALESLLAGKIE